MSGRRAKCRPIGCGWHRLNGQELVRQGPILRVVLEAAKDGVGQWLYLMDSQGTNLELEPNAVSLGDIQQLDKFLPDAVQSLHIVFAPCPQLDTVHLASQAHDCPTNFIAILQFLPYERHRQPSPTPIQQGWVVLHRKDPLSTLRIRGVFPHGLDPGLEDMIVRVPLELRRWLEPVEITAE